MQKKWKYKVVTIKVSAFAKLEERMRIQTETLDRLGMEGWELVQLKPAPNSGHPTFYLKQPY